MKWNVVYHLTKIEFVTYFFLSGTDKMRITRVCTYATQHEHAYKYYSKMFVKEQHDIFSILFTKREEKIMRTGNVSFSNEKKNIVNEKNRNIAL